MTQEQENKRFEALLIKYGAYELERRIQRLESTRKYYRSLPFEGWQDREGMDAVDLASNSDPLAEIIADESRKELLSVLTERELWVAQKAMQGYKPRDMAALRGKTTSNADRWVKHSVKLKLAAKLAADSAADQKEDRVATPAAVQVDGISGQPA